MCFERPTPRLFVTWYAIALHWIWGCLLVTSSAPLNITAIASVSKFGLVSQQSAAILYFMVALLAMIGLIAPKIAGLMFMIPQQIVLFVSAYGAISAMLTGHFADGVVRPTSFLIADQAPAVIIAVLYLFGLVHTYLIGKDKDGH